MSSYRIPFNKAFMVGGELEYVAQSIASGDISGDGRFTKRVQGFMEERFAAKRVLMTTSCTSALEMAALLCNIEPGDEVILPSFTFVSTANAFLLRGAKLRFIDVRPDTLNMDEKQLSSLITGRTKAIVPVHYAGVACEMDTILKEARRDPGIFVVEDAAQGVNSTYRGKFLGTMGDFGTYSFHNSKNFSCGEGGALIIRDESMTERAEIIREKGTNRSKFFRGQVDKYTWEDIGSSYVPSDILAAYLLEQLQHAEHITSHRKRVYDAYLAGLQPLADRGLMRLPTIPEGCTSNYHIFGLIMESLERRTALIDHLKARGILAVFHYVPLHTSPMGMRMGYQLGMLPVTESLSDRLLRLPLYPTLSIDDVQAVIESMFDFFRVRRSSSERVA